MQVRAHVTEALDPNNVHAACSLLEHRKGQ